MLDQRTTRPGRAEPPGTKVADTWGELCLRLRQAWDTTQALAAWKAGIAAHTWSSWERGAVAPSWRNRLWLREQAAQHHIPIAGTLTRVPDRHPDGPELAG